MSSIKLNASNVKALAAQKKEYAVYDLPWQISSSLK